jgi:lactoylglutathione lyase
MTMVQFAYTILYVKDVQRTLGFYEAAFGFKRKFIAPDDSYGELITGATTLSFASISLANSNLKNGFLESNPDNKPFAVEVAFTTNNVDEVLKAAIDAGATLVENPEAKPWGQVVAYIRDINGFLIEICTPLG